MANLDSLEKVGEDAYNKGFYHHAEDIYNQVFGAYIAKGDTLKQIDVLIFLAEINRASGFFEESLQYLEHANEISRTKAKNVLLFKIQNRRAAVYYELKNLRKSVFLANASLSLLKGTENTESKVIKSSNYSILGASYRDKRIFDSAQYYLQKAYFLALKNNDKNEIVTSVFNKGWLFIKSQSLDSALYYGKLAQKLCIEHGFLGRIENAYVLIADSYRKMGNFEKALMYKDKHINRRDSMFQEGIKSGYFKYTEDQAKLVLLRDKEILEEKIKNQDIIELFTFSILGIMVISLVIYFGRSRYYKKLSKTIEKNRLELDEKNKELLSLGLLKDKLFSILAHDIQGPLNSIIGFLDIVSDDSLDESTKQGLLQKLKTQVLSTKQLLVGIVSWSKSQLGGLEIKKAELNLKEILESEIALVTQAAQLKKITIGLNCDLSKTVSSDGEIISLIVRNLLNNAIKFTNKGGKIELGCENADDGFIIYVKDNGIGMDATMVNALFEKNAAHTSGTNKEMGFGLGLLLCKDFAEKLQAKISVESQLGSGSTFTLVFPA